jgi:dephospho-CoA kinase
MAGSDDVKVGLTGGIGSGKTAVSDLLGSYGALIIDSDVLAREVVAPGSEGLAEIVAEFGPEVLADDGSLDRERMAKLVFAEDGARARLNAIVHPLVRRRADALAAAAPPGTVVVNAVPLLVEARLVHLFDLVVVVDVPPEVQLDRLVRLRGMTEADARARIAAQAPREERLIAADVIIDNSGAPEDLEPQVRALWEELRGRV